MALPNYSIEDLLPHRNSMLLIQEILEGDPKAAVSRAVVNENWPLYDGHRVSSLVLIVEGPASARATARFPG